MSLYKHIWVQNLLNITSVQEERNNGGHFNTAFGTIINSVHRLKAGLKSQVLHTIFNLSS